MLTRVLAIAALAGGLALAVLGTVLFLNVLSLRELAESTRLSPAVWAVFEVRDDLSDRRAQGLELLGGLIGAAIVIVAVWRLHTRDLKVR